MAKDKAKARHTAAALIPVPRTLPTVIAISLSATPVMSSHTPLPLLAKSAVRRAGRDHQQGFLLRIAPGFVGRALDSTDVEQNFCLLANF
jgi:hypothetical protein